MHAKIDVRNISKSFASSRGMLQVVDDVSFSVGDGELVAIVGPSGCGKSTLMNMLCGFVRPDRGSVLVDGTERVQSDPKAILISQHGSIFPWLTVRENLTFGLDGRPESNASKIVEYYTNLVGLSGFENSYPHELSGGMLKRAEFARALAVEPEILYMDEPFSALDALMSLRIRSELRRILEKTRKTVVLITHDVEEAIHIADRVLVLSERPARIQAIFAVPFPHPRRLAVPHAQTLRLEILRELGVDEVLE